MPTSSSCACRASPRPPTCRGNPCSPPASDGKFLCFHGARCGAPFFLGRRGAACKVEIGLVRFAELTVGEVAEHDGVGGVLELLLVLGFGSARRSFLAQALAKF